MKTISILRHTTIIMTSVSDPEVQIRKWDIYTGRKRKLDPAKFMKIIITYLLHGAESFLRS